MRMQTGPLRWSSLAEVFCVAPAKIDMFWPTVEPLLAEAMDYSNFDTTQDLHAELMKEQALLWIVHTGTDIDAALVTQLKTDKHGKFLAIWALAGKNMGHWLQLHSVIEAHAKAEGCTRMVHELRPGFARVLMKTFNYRMTHATIEKVI